MQHQLNATNQQAAVAATMTSQNNPLRDPNRLPSVLTSDIHNEAELIFTILENKDRNTVSSLDTLTLLRGMGMNPVDTDMDYLREVMAEPVEKLEQAYREEEARKERERRKEEERKGKKITFVNKKAPGKDGAPGADGVAPGEEIGPDGKKRKIMTEPQEEIKNIDWNIFINAVEPIFRDNHQEQEEILAALKVFDTDGRGRISREQLIQIVTTNGESVLSPAEVKILLELFPEDIGFVEFAQRVQGTYVPPSQEELDAIEEAERRERDARMAKERDAAAAADPLAGLLGGIGGGGDASATGGGDAGGDTPAAE